MKVWIVWKRIALLAFEQVELITADEGRALRLAASSGMMRAEAYQVEDTP